ncbi:MAG: SH3 domain-containing protein [Desulfobulbia bacterium]
MTHKSLGKAATKAVIAVALVLVFQGIGSTESSAATCYEVTAVKSLYIRDRSSKKGNILTTVKSGTLVKKVGVPFCGPFWCRIEYGQYKGFASQKFLKKAKCP